MPLNTPATRYPHLSFDGIDDHVYLYDGARVRNNFDGGGSVYAEFSTATHYTDTARVVFYKWSILSDRSRIRFYYPYDDEGTIKALDWVVTDPATMELGATSYKVTITHNADLLEGPKIYFSGVERTADGTAPEGVRESNENNVFFLGRSSEKYFPGAIRNLVLYDRILTEAEMLYNATHPSNPVMKGMVGAWLEGMISGTKWYDTGGGGNDGDIVGATTINTNRKCA